jgi:hypothetical protein
VGKILAENLGMRDGAANFENFMQSFPGWWIIALNKI